MTEALIIAAAIVGWIGCGIIAYGMWIAEIHVIWAPFDERWGDDQWSREYPRVRREAFIGALFGPVGLFATWMTRVTSRKEVRGKGLRFHR